MDELNDVDVETHRSGHDFRQDGFTCPVSGDGENCTRGWAAILIVVITSLAKRGF